MPASFSPVHDAQTESPMTGTFGGGGSGPSEPVASSASFGPFEPSGPSSSFSSRRLRSFVSSLRYRTGNLPPLWGVDLALILISVAGLAAIALNFEMTLAVIALGLYRLFDATIGIIILLVVLLLLGRILLGRR